MRPWVTIPWACSVEVYSIEYRLGGLVVFSVQHVLIAYGLVQSVSIDRLIDSASDGILFKFTCLQRNLQRSKKSGVHIKVNSLIIHALTSVFAHQC
ncbi:hypothetical protein PHET_01638 [Paragonimus heterotremus]|uniref:Uncharacterized protein n=1 Tax=Paragonimus heterotremus TaxID=100268 RepID=A0A8J4STB4_9TREM|nr:hypothetical protein PHET_01638 [Paragonimus heterotremus]